jgi:hypothetical protein
MIVFNNNPLITDVVGQLSESCNERRQCRNRRANIDMLNGDMLTNCRLWNRMTSEAVFHHQYEQFLCLRNKEGRVGKGIPVQSLSLKEEIKTT